jgi:hypothetical protein
LQIKGFFRAICTCSRTSALAFALAVLVAPSAPIAAIIDSGRVNLPVPETLDGIFLNMVTGTSATVPPFPSGWDFNPYADSGTLHFFASILGTNASAIVGTASPNIAAALAPGMVVGPGSGFVFGAIETTGTTFQATAVTYLGLRFTDETPPGATYYGFVELQTTAATGFPATIVRYVYENSGAPIVVFALPPGLVSAASRKTHGTAGTFDLTLAATPLNPTTESRNGSAHSIVFTFDKPVMSGSASVSEGTATAGAPTFIGNEMTVPLTGVINEQYVTVDVSGVVASDGSTGGSGSVRAGFLLGDVNRSRQVTVADVGILNAALLQTVSNANFQLDVNVDGRLTVADKGQINANLLKKLPAP